MSVFGLASLGSERGAERDRQLYDWVFALGYAHLLGAAWRALVHAPREGLQGASAALMLALAAAQGFALYAIAIRHSPLWAVPLMLLSTWHSIENDRRWPALYAQGPTPARDVLSWPWVCFELAWLCVALVVFSRTGASQALALEIAVPEPAFSLAAALFSSLCLVAASCRRAVSRSQWLVWALAWLAAPWLGELLRFAEAFCIVTLYHVASWACFVAQRRYRGGGLARSAWSAGWYLAAVVALLTLRWLPVPDEWRAWVFSPALYLFFTALHVVQTGTCRLRDQAR